MSEQRRFVHILDDLAMGGVTRALKNFETPVLAGLGQHESIDIRKTSARAQNANDVAVVHFTANWRKLGWLLDLRLRGGFSRTILIEHSYTEGYEASEVVPKRRFRQMLRLAYRLVDQVVAVSNAQREWMLHHKLAKADKIVAIPQSRLCDELLSIAPCKRDFGPLQIRAFGRFHKQKGFDLLVKAMARVPSTVAQLKIAGTGPDTTYLQTLARDLDHVEICDPFSSPIAFISDADLVAIPSRWEAFGLVGTEARAAGRPILAATVDGLRDQLDEDGFAHEPGSVSSLVDAIYRSANARDINARGLSSRERATTEFDLMVERWHALLSEA
ncbi:MAG: glycosyltransferase family 4 protein [Pseudomonadota bacterium]